jgi:hypothetical protein
VSTVYAGPVAAANACGLSYVGSAQNFMRMAPCLEVNTSARTSVVLQFQIRLPAQASEDYGLYQRLRGKVNAAAASAHILIPGSVHPDDTIWLHPNEGAEFTCSRKAKYDKWKRLRKAINAYAPVRFQGEGSSPVIAGGVSAAVKMIIKLELEDSSSADKADAQLWVALMIVAMLEYAAEQQPQLQQVSGVCFFVSCIVSCMVFL